MFCFVFGQPEDVNAILQGKNALKYSGAEVDAMRAVSNAYQNRSLDTFEIALKNYKSRKIEQNGGEGIKSEP